MECLSKIVSQLNNSIDGLTQGKVLFLSHDIFFKFSSGQVKQILYHLKLHTFIEQPMSIVML